MHECTVHAKKSTKSAKKKKKLKTQNVGNAKARNAIQTAPQFLFCISPHFAKKFCTVPIKLIYIYIHNSHSKE